MADSPISLAELRTEYDTCLDLLDEQAEQWIEARVKGKDTDPIALKITETDRQSRRLEKKIRKAEKRERLAA